LLLAILASALGFTGLMMLLSVLGKTEKSASGMTWAVLMIMAMVGGGMIPLFAMPRWMAGLGQFSPVQWTVMSFEGALWRQFSVAEVLPYVLMLALLGAGGFLLGSYLFERKTRV
ncbi:ABC transporter permease, partial [Thiolapillus sp.]